MGTFFKWIGILTVCFFVFAYFVTKDTIEGMALHATIQETMSDGLPEEEITNHLKFTEEKDDFSNSTIYQLKIDSFTKPYGALFISCQAKKKLEIQLSVSSIMFPDSSKLGKSMVISTTHKFDKKEKAVTSNWSMNYMKYKNAWYEGKAKKFINNAIKSGQLNLKLNKRSDVFKFKLEGTAEHLKTILEKC